MSLVKLRTEACKRDKVSNRKMVGGRGIVDAGQSHRVMGPKLVSTTYGGYYYSGTPFFLGRHPRGKKNQLQRPQKPLQAVWKPLKKHFESD